MFVYSSSFFRLRKSNLNIFQEYLASFFPIPFNEFIMFTCNNIVNVEYYR